MQISSKTMGNGFIISSSLKILRVEKIIPIARNENANNFSPSAQTILFFIVTFVRTPYKKLPNFGGKNIMAIAIAIKNCPIIK